MNVKNKGKRMVNQSGTKLTKFTKIVITIFSIFALSGITLVFDATMRIGVMQFLIGVTNLFDFYAIQKLSMEAFGIVHFIFWSTLVYIVIKTELKIKKSIKGAGLTKKNIDL